jgi:outer membrane lipoprotein
MTDAGGGRAMILAALPGLLICVFFLSMISSCSPPILKDWRELADPSLTFSRVLRNPYQYRGEIVIWGGIIEGVRPIPGGTALRIIETPLRAGGRPDPRITEGRFFARIGRTLDPKVYARGKVVSLAGMITGVNKEPGRELVLYPVVDVFELHLWEGIRLKSFPQKWDWEDVPPPENWDWEDFPYKENWDSQTE